MESFIKSSLKTNFAQRLLPLSEIIATDLQLDSPYAAKVWQIYNLLVEKFGNEYSVLIDRSKDELCSVVDEHVAEAIVRVRRGNIKVVPGTMAFTNSSYLTNRFRSRVYRKEYNS